MDLRVLIPGAKGHESSYTRTVTQSELNLDMDAVKLMNEFVKNDWTHTITYLNDLNDKKPEWVKIQLSHIILFILRKTTGNNGFLEVEFLINYLKIFDFDTLKEILKFIIDTYKSDDNVNIDESMEIDNGAMRRKSESSDERR